VAPLWARRPAHQFRIDALIDDGDLAAAVGQINRVDGHGRSTPLIWLVRVAEGRMAEMWTYHTRESGRGREHARRTHRGMSGRLIMVGRRRR